MGEENVNMCDIMEPGLLKISWDDLMLLSSLNRVGCILLHYTQPTHPHMGPPGGLTYPVDLASGLGLTNNLEQILN